MKRVIYAVLSAIVPLALAWLGGMDFVRSPDLAFTTAVSILAFVGILLFPG